MLSYFLITYLGFYQVHCEEKIKWKVSWMSLRQILIDISNLFSFRFCVKLTAFFFNILSMLAELTCLLVFDPELTEIFDIDNSQLFVYLLTFKYIPKYFMIYPTVIANHLNGSWQKKINLHRNVKHITHLTVWGPPKFHLNAKRLGRNVLMTLRFFFHFL